MKEWLCEAPEGDMYGIDRVEFIRCKDCKHCRIYANGCNSYCEAGHNISYVDGYCSEAEPKDGGK